MATGTIDTNSKGDVAATLALTTETLVSLYLAEKTGATGNYRIGLEVSPDSGTTWFEQGEILSRPGIVTISVVATNVRVKVIEAQGATSTVSVHLIAR